LVLYEAVVVCKPDKRSIIRVPATYCLVDFDFDARTSLEDPTCLNKVAKCVAGRQT